MKVLEKEAPTLLTLYYIYAQLPRGRSPPPQSRRRVVRYRTVRHSVTEVLGSVLLLLGCLDGRRDDLDGEDCKVKPLGVPVILPRPRRFLRGLAEADL